MFYVGALLKGTTDFTLPFTTWQAVLAAIAMALAIGPMEEFGWRGVALPLLQRRFAPFWASIILGIIWGLWHIPAFLIGGTMQSAWAFGPFFVGTIGIALIVTALFNAGRGSLLLPILFHLQTNNPLWPDAQPWDNYLAALIAVVVVWLYRDTMFKRGSGATSILHGEHTDSDALPAPAAAPLAGAPR